MDIFLDTSDINEIFSAYENNKLVKGFTTNPSLMRKAKVKDYTKFVKKVTNKIKDHPLSFEIFADELNEMEYQIQKISEFGENVFVKVPVTNTEGIPTYDLIHKMSNKGIKLNVTAIFTKEQIERVCGALWTTTDAIVSIFSGRISDTGKDAEEFIKIGNREKFDGYVKILWASVREVYNIYQAKSIGCDIITVTPDMIKKYIELKDKTLEQFSLDTVKMFYEDAKASGYTI